MSGSYNDIFDMRDGYKTEICSNKSAEIMVSLFQYGKKIRQSLEEVFFQFHNATLIGIPVNKSVKSLGSRFEF